MAKSCCMCGKELSIFSTKVALKDGYVCGKCLKAGGINSLSSNENLRTEQVVAALESRTEIARNFHATQSFDKIEIDMNSQAFRLNRNIYLFDNLLSYTYHEDPENSRLTVQNGGSSGATIGGVVGGLGRGLIGGTIGAVVGGKIGSLFATTMCNYMYIGISLNDVFETYIRLDYITEKTRISSDEYTKALKCAKECLDGLQIITAHNASRRQAAEEEKKANSKREVYIQDRHLTASELAEELAIYKNLLHNGDITQEEFELKKRKLLDMI